jgi:hypothetical protein
MWVLDTLKHLQLIVDHGLVSFNDFLENNLDCDLLVVDLGFTHDTIGTRTQCSPESVLSFLVVAVWLAMEAVEHTSDCRVSVLSWVRSTQEDRHIGGYERPSAPKELRDATSFDELTTHGWNTGRRSVPAG